MDLALMDRPTPCIRRASRHRRRISEDDGLVTRTIVNAGIPLLHPSSTAVAIRDLELAVLQTGVTMTARDSFNDSTVARLVRDGEDIVRLKLPRHDLLLAKIVSTESGLGSGDRRAFDIGSEIIACIPTPRAGTGNMPSAWI
jgi:hypothetical protein